MRGRVAGFAGAVVLGVCAGLLLDVPRGVATAVPQEQPADLAELLARFDKGDAEAATALAKRGEAAAPALVERLVGSDPKLSAAAADVLVAVGAPAVATLAREAKAAPVPARVPLLGVLGRIAADVDAAIDPLVAALADPDAKVREAAARGLLAAGPRAKAAEDALKLLLFDRFVEVRIAASAALLRSVQSGPHGLAIREIVSAAGHKEPSVRAKALALLVEARISQDVAFPVLLAATYDPITIVRMAALRGLVSFDGNRGRDSLVEALARAARSSDPEEHAFARVEWPKFTDVPFIEALRFGGPFRGDRLKRLDSRTSPEGKRVDAAVNAALDWLARHQSPDGRWDCDGFHAQCKGNVCVGDGLPQFDPGVTGLALLCFLGAGETHLQGAHKETVARGLQYLRSAMDAEGSLRGGGKSTIYEHVEQDDRLTLETRADGRIYNHAAATVALCEVLLLTRDSAVEDLATKAVGFALKSKNPYLAWRYNVPPDGDNDTSITAWMVWAIATARAAEIKGAQDPNTLRDAVAWVDKMTEPEFGRTGYQQRGRRPCRPNWSATRFPPDKVEGLTAAGVLTRVLNGHTRRDDEFILKGSDLVLKRLPTWDVDRGTIDFCYWFWGSMAMRQVGGEHWKRWGDALRPALLDHQRAEPGRDERGSWDPFDPWSRIGGRVYSTAMCCLALEAAWRIDPLPNMSSPKRK